MNAKLTIGIAAVTLASGAALATGASGSSERTAAAPPPGGNAPKALVGTYTTKLTRADIVSVTPALPSGGRWRLAILNSEVVKSPRALGLIPLGHGGAAVPFGVTGKRIYLQCMSEGVGTLPGHPTRGHSTYTWSLKGRTLTFKLVSQPCKSSDDRVQPVVLTSEPWRKVG